MGVISGLIKLGTDAVAVAVVVARAYNIILGVRCSWAYGEEILLIGVARGPG